MNMLQSWKESLNFFQPKNFNLFALVTLKSVKEAYFLLIKYWWWLYAIVIGLIFTVSFQALAKQEFRLFIFSLLLGIGAKIIHLLIFLATRPSVERKTFSYFCNYLMKFWYLVAIIWFCAFSRIEFIPLFQIFMALFILFTLDSDGTIKAIGKSVVRALQMLVYNLPLFLMTYIGFTLFYLIIWLIHYPFKFIGLSAFGNAFTHLLVFLLIPIEICFITNIYIKKLHEQSDLYFPQP